MGGVYSDHLEYDLTQDEVDECDPIMFQKYLANMTAKTGKYAGDQLFHAISCDINPTTVNYMYFPHNKVEATQVLNVLTYILSEELLINFNFFIIIPEIEQATLGIWNKNKRTSADPNELNNE